LKSTKTTTSEKSKKDTHGKTFWGEGGKFWKQIKEGGVDAKTTSGSYRGLRNSNPEVTKGCYQEGRGKKKSNWRIEKDQCNV